MELPQRCNFWWWKLAILRKHCSCMTELGCSHLFPDFGKNQSAQYISTRDDEAQRGGGRNAELTLLGFDKKLFLPH